MAIDGSGLLVCHDSEVNGIEVPLLMGSNLCSADQDVGLTCSLKRLQRTVTQNRHFDEQAEFGISHGWTSRHSAAVARSLDCRKQSAARRVCRCARLGSDNRGDRCRTDQTGWHGHLPGHARTIGASARRPPFKPGGQLAIPTHGAWENSKRSATGLRGEMRFQDG
jgi:hypothetical protein